MNKREKFVDWINEKYKPENSKHPAGMKTSDGEFIISGEVGVFYPEFKENEPLPKIGVPLIDYYGEFRGGYPWIHQDVIDKAKQMKLCLEWRDPGSIIIYEE